MELIEVIPPRHPGYPVGLEHVGLVVGDEYEGAVGYRDFPTARQDQGPVNQSLNVTFDNGRTVEFHRPCLHDVVVKDCQPLGRCHHANR